MKIFLPKTLFQHNRLKEIYYKSFLVKEMAQKFYPDQQESLPVKKTNAEIRLMDIQWGCSRKSMVRLLANPRYIIKKEDGESSEILFFKHQIHGEKAIIQCHFLKDQFYFAHIDFISSLSSGNRKIIRLVEEKYGKINAKEEGKIIIEDPDKNKIIVEENVYLRIEYLTGKKTTVEKLKKSLLKTADVNSQQQDGNYIML